MRQWLREMERERDRPEEIEEDYFALTHNVNHLSLILFPSFFAQQLLMPFLLSSFSLFQSGSLFPLSDPSVIMPSCPVSQCSTFSEAKLQWGKITGTFLTG